MCCKLDQEILVVPPFDSALRAEVVVTRAVPKSCLNIVVKMLIDWNGEDVQVILH